ncbi:MAG: hypothetical protein N3E50_10045 [Candidatus Goldbacteria bacterium]|nr:hypothetical protein [Candidatus Goldiibacteriota bacterium]
MKKTLIILISILLLITAVFMKKFKNIHHRKNVIIAGNTAKDFILGIKNLVIYRLSDFKGKYNIILAFLDASPQSNKINDIIKDNRLYTFLQKNKDVIWFNITKDNSNHFIIEEKTQKIDLSYRTLSENIPSIYNFKNLPTIIIINKSGIIQLVYSGYSPTIVSDILETLKLLQ